MTPEEDHLLELRIIDGLSSEKGNAEENESDEPQGMNLHVHKARVLTPEFAIVDFDDARTGQLRSGEMQFRAAPALATGRGNRGLAAPHSETMRREAAYQRQAGIVSFREACGGPLTVGPWRRRNWVTAHKGRQQFGSNMGVLARSAE